jgi:hypothetical protein
VRPAYTFLNKIKKEDHALFLINKPDRTTVNREIENIFVAHFECSMFFPNILFRHTSEASLPFGLIQERCIFGKCSICESDKANLQSRPILPSIKCEAS